ncbi:MAG: hypothetical protein K2X08_00220, partial [Chlamydiales bacterium]|nr:hypothetical protein [Chlamydiales bacterium]
IFWSSVAFSLMLLAWGLLGLAQSGDKRSLWSAFLGGTLLLLLKETAVIHLGCFILALGVLVIWEKVVPSSSLCLGAQKWRRQDIIKASFLSLMMLFFFYSGTLFNCRGLLTVFETVPAWIHTGMGAGGHEKIEYQWWGMNFYWLALMLRYEWPSCLGFLYAGRLLGKKTVAVTRYLAIYSLGVFLAYSLIRYKTPWCLISILWPFALFFGMCCQELLQLCSSFCKNSLVRWCCIGIIIFLLLGSFMSCLRLNFWNYTDALEPYVYVQTSPEIERVVAPLLFMAKKDPLYYHLNGQILLSSYYPLPWILGDFTSIGYFSQEKKPSYFNGDFICIELSRSQEIEKQLKEVYYREEFELRDGMERCIVYFKKRIFYPYFEKSNPSKKAIFY